MNAAQDDNAPRRVTIQVVTRPAPERASAPVPAPPPAPKSRQAQAQARYRARKRGESVPLRKPGPRAQSREAWQARAFVAERELKNARDELRALKAVPVYQQQRWSIGQGQLATAARNLLQQLGGASDGSDDAPAVREMLRDVLAAVEARYEHWRD